ncbi:1-acyl-sn-glycerol-3-phosphate acyltransferase [Poseidonocella sedimentorum]|uniref:Glycerol-3-phosphate acyltransferase n=1 Tax=Poseidonocella sedimentorum TaxID=871652 RepID=A0A1I6DS23_9RHOB|nr:1-acyl-sn-glycerol-3-phosphate acyltransferase [Poseidonocella sedimentorum]SFR08192.1 glycerol-3-phosphate acyltransferase [Poseidonocella sedimentorum]
MTSTVELPLWLFIVILLFAAITAASHLLFPSVRWFFRRRMERVVTRVNKRLARPIQPFKLLRRQDMIQRLVYDPEVTKAIVVYAEANGVREDVAFEQAKRYAREIVPSFSATAYFGFAIRAARWLSNALYRVRLSHDDEAAIRRIDPEATIVFVMNHRSNMDYVLVTYLAARKSALSYAVGEWARLWPLSALVRGMGAYFIRRNSRNALYRKVLAQYVRKATDGGVAQAIFPEGGLSLNGAVQTPKMGLLSYLVEGYRSGGRNVVFVPVALNYDRVLEDRVLLGAGKAGARRFQGGVRTAFAFVAERLWLWVSRRYRRFGYAAVHFGLPLSLAEAVAQEEEPTEALATALMARIARDVPVLPVPLVAQVLARGGDWARGDLDAETAALKARLADVPGHFPSEDTAEIVEFALRLLKERKLVVEGGGTITVPEEHRPTIEFYARSIAQHLESPAPDKQTSLTAGEVQTERGTPESAKT